VPGGANSRCCVFVSLDMYQTDLTYYAYLTSFLLCLLGSCLYLTLACEVSRARVAYALRRMSR
jgi:hypothetical protein